MRTPTRRRAVAVAAAAALVLSACGGDDGDTADETTDEAETEEPADDTDDTEDAGADEGADEDAAGTDEPLAVTGTNDLVWDVEELSAPAGTIEFELTCEGVMHDLVIEETDEMVAECGPDETATGSVDLDAGEYAYVCTVPGHTNMRGTLTVT